MPCSIVYQLLIFVFFHTLSDWTPAGRHIAQTYQIVDKSSKSFGQKLFLVTFYKNSINKCDLSNLNTCMSTGSFASFQQIHIYTKNINSGERYMTVWLFGNGIRRIHQSIHVDCSIVRSINYIVKTD